MDFSRYFPVWDQLTDEERQKLQSSATLRHAEKGTVLHRGSADCLGLIFIRSGQLRAYILSDEGREVTLYRLFDWDTCLFSAACMMQSIQFDIFISAEKDTEFYLVPPGVYGELMQQSAPIANYTSALMASRFSDVMWLVEQIMWKSFDSRLATFLLEESNLEQSDTLQITHEKIAGHLGTAREVVTRMLRYFQSEGLVSLSRGTVELTNKAGLKKYSGD